MNWICIACATLDRTAFYGTRPYTHLRQEFESRLRTLQQDGDVPDPRLAQITRLKADNAILRKRLAERALTIAELAGLKTQALSRLAAQHEELVHLQSSTTTTSRVIRLATSRPGPPVA